MEMSGTFVLHGTRRSILRILAGAAGAVLADALTACGLRGLGRVMAGPSRTTAPITLAWLPWMGFLATGGTAAATAVLYHATLPFRRKNPGVQIKVSITNGANNAAPNLVETAILAGTGPDVFESYASPDAFIRKGLLLDLETYIRKDNLDLTVYPADAVAFIRESSAAASKTGHGFFTLPAYANITALAVNEGLLDQLGLPYPEPDWTYGQWSRIWEATTQKSITASDLSRAGYAMFWLSGMGTPVPPPAFLRSFGGEYVDPSNPARSGLMSTGSRAFWEWVVPLVVAGVIRQFGAFTPPNSLGQGHVAVKCWQSAFLLNALHDLSRLKWDWYAMPVGSAGQYTFMSHDWLGVNAGTKHPDLAWEFAKWLSWDPSFDEAMAHISLRTPIRKDQWTRWASVVKATAPGLAHKNLGAYVEAGTGTQGQPYGGRVFKYGEVSAMGLVLKWVNAAVAGKVAVVTALQEAARQVDALEQADAAAVAHASTA